MTSLLRDFNTKLPKAIWRSKISKRFLNFFSLFLHWIFYKFYSINYIFNIKCRSVSYSNAKMLQMKFLTKSFSKQLKIRRIRINLSRDFCISKFIIFRLIWSWWNQIQVAIDDYFIPKFKIIFDVWTIFQQNYVIILWIEYKSFLEIQLIPDKISWIF